MRNVWRLQFIVWLVLVGCQSQAPDSVGLGDVTRPLVTAPPTNTLPAPTNTPLVIAAPATPTPLGAGESDGAAGSIATATVVPTATATPTVTPTPTPPRGPFPPPGLSLVPFAEVGERITDLTHAGDGTGRLFVTTQAGRVLIVRDGVVDPQPFLDVTSRVTSAENEQGLLGITFDPEYARTGEFYINYTAAANQGATVVARYRVSADPNIADVDSETRLLVIPQPAGNHNAGQLQFGPDGYLYVGMGDGGQAGDPWDNAENLMQPLGKMLRIAVRGQETYAIPADNPFVGRDDVLAEIWAYGLRNPWRYAFDRVTGDLYISDVGQNSYEEINFQPAADPGGTHYGWDTVEGYTCYEPASGCDRAGKQEPIFIYGHDKGCSVTGGYVYRGEAFPALQGTYFLADFCTGIFWGLQRQPDGSWLSAELLDAEANVASFGEDEAGELYVLDLAGTIYRLVTTGR